MQYRHHPVASQTGPDFAAEIPDDGYAWWYVDALSDCGQHGLTLIAMLGCVFSPYYARARRRGPTAALEHSALNVALYRGDGRRWAMTERGAAAVQRERHALQIGPSSLHWSSDSLEIAIDETTAPWPRTLRGKIRVLPTALTAQSWALDPAGRHLWWPIAVRARIEVQLSQPQLTWQGSAYFDANQGVVPLEHDFDRWSWSRAHRRDDAIVFYDTVSRNGEPAAELALRFDQVGRAEPFWAPPKAKVKRTGWGIERPTRCDAGLQPRLIETLESAPFYARSLLETTITGSRMQAFHESVSLSRFTSRWVQTLLPVRLPRR
jgi:carotenoid 1,2-hydratase